MGISQIIGLLMGISLFLYGMALMGDGLKQVSGNKLEPILFRLSGTQLKGMLFGAGVTAVIQSSGATSVMVVGFVNSGIMKLRQAIPIILGSILGTSITGWVICLSYIEGAEGVAGLLSTATLTGVMAIIGMLLRMLAKRQSTVNIGNILLGFVILMVGMSSMSSSVSPLKDEPWFLETLTKMSNPAVGILVGALFTVVLQSASASVGILQALSVTGAMTFESTLPLLLGVSVGASAPVLLSSLGATIGGKRTAYVYLVENIMGVLSVGSLFYILNAIIDFSFTSLTMNPFSIALVNTVFRLAVIAILLPFTDVIEALVKAIIPDKEQKEAEEEAPEMIRLEERFLAHPALAIEQCRLTIASMAELADRSIESALGLLWNYSDNRFKLVTDMEARADQYEDILGTYLAKLTGKTMTTQQSREISKFLHVLSDFERITDHARNIAENARERVEKKVTFSGEAQHELHVVTDAVSEVTRLATEAFKADDLETAVKVEPLETVIDNLCDEMKLHHVERLQQGTCTIHQGFIFNDLLTNLERVSDHCSNVAVAMIELDAGSFDTHEYLEHVEEKQSEQFHRDLEIFRTRYLL